MEMAETGGNAISWSRPVFAAQIHINLGFQSLYFHPMNFPGGLPRLLKDLRNKGALCLFIHWLQPRVEHSLFMRLNSGSQCTILWP